MSNHVESSLVISQLENLENLFSAIRELSTPGSSAANLASIGMHLSSDWANDLDLAAEAAATAQS